MKKLNLRLSVSFLSSLFVTTALMGCNALPSVQVVPAQLQRAAASQPKNQTDRYLCSVENREGSAIVKILDLQQQGVRSVMIPGRVKNMDGVQSEGKLYVNAIPAGSQDQTIYEVTIQTGQVRRLLSFSQIGLNTEDFLIQNGKLYAVGVQNHRTTLMSYDFKAYGWQPVVYDFQPGVLQFGNQSQDLQVLHFGSGIMTRTMVNLANRQTYSFNYSFNYKAQGTEDYLYSGIISRNGRYIFASINDKIERYQLEDKQVNRLAPITLPHALPRYVALSQDGQQLYISHNQENRISRVIFNPDGVTYRIEDLAFPGHHQELAVF
ncbi:hypothetical protein COW36_21690 [bacterium (Candidatus Blackallbacteria) CG17_big_fil_post_rev_8_21_14_2_50_48_46]|uniref:Uncharacterized protein n=1 Tax=bacterium (Candidatus Blackallbacteria) CG17_big_fil_post_rev_8_21_14_2_50_48_46 TaxID=2014261 RepID=A0A2M7FYF4_9BACT|nr:MAG: hypothetical protein COW64_11170 [bacterium (Candidatus Blackallbacteria) CG18_big_fil_WC_8_21_14_2_50_49_26]PIW14383.1 MAG: hypothetical protein COW36_21690 [bacterium (Candidatus Blackallbacteria) CG17_big_fil_post_rev_8_21_14_2_50_48_46]PIW46890.1 MAG: hypothetical protein COW20_14105 [bacterium (Candidatus Blackallbacteria) CG13_big_fil_rev_8_21_14_2_50_49_14]